MSSGGDAMPGKIKQLITGNGDKNKKFGEVSKLCIGIFLLYLNFSSQEQFAWFTQNKLKAVNFRSIHYSFTSFLLTINFYVRTITQKGTQIITNLYTNNH